MERTWIRDTIGQVGNRVKVAGWVNSIRSHGKLVFVDLRDWTGILQVVFRVQNKDAYEAVKAIKPEWVVEIEGEIRERPEGLINPQLETGKVELEAQKLLVFNSAKTLPITIDTDGYEIDEEKRLRYRYIDLRRERLQKNLKERQRVIHFMREFLIDRDFIEIETPILTKSTPEGARDFLVPARLQPGKFYALPQSPQQYKQLLMVSGFERYFQIARCLRDEDPRADRQAEFTQLDIEMAFIEQEDVLSLVEELFISLVETLYPEKKIREKPFPRLNYQDVIKKYKTDKPDLRTDKKDANELAFAFIVNFPMFEWKEKENRWDAVHHPFTRPQTDNPEEIKSNPEKILAYQYDFVLNGVEIGGGSLRTYKIEVLEAVFEVLGHKKEEFRRKFKHLYEAFQYGVPPHGGIAPGIDRFLAVLLNEPSIREVMAFPKTGDNRDLMMDVPSEVSEEQLKELHIQIIKENGKED